MSESTQAHGAATGARGGSPFSRGAVLGLLVVGFAAFMAMLYFIGAGDTGGNSGRGGSHASADGLNGFSGLVQLLDANGIEVERSRTPEGLETPGLLILTPPSFSDPEEIGRILQNREYIGPTLVILPKWETANLPRNIAEEDRDEVRDDFVALAGVWGAGWTANLPAPYAFTQQIEDVPEGSTVRWRGLGRSGELPTAKVATARIGGEFERIVIDPTGRVLAMHVLGDEGSYYNENANWTTFVIEPDLMNNYGLADADRAALAIALVQEAGYADTDRVTFDMTLNGFGGSTNLLTLAFQPPFLAATLCLVLAMLIVAWRAFLRFGPTAVSAPGIAFGKQRLVTNGAGLIVRAGRLGLLAKPYAALMERRIGRLLGLARPDAEAIDQALRVRLPREEPYSHRLARLENADKPADILSAAQELTRLGDALSQSRTGIPKR